MYYSQILIVNYLAEKNLDKEVIQIAVTNRAEVLS